MQPGRVTDGIDVAAGDVAGRIVAAQSFDSSARSVVDRDGMIGIKLVNQLVSAAQRFDRVFVPFRLIHAVPRAHPRMAFEAVDDRFEAGFCSRVTRFGDLA